MFGLIRLALWGLVGYAMYQLVRGLAGEVSQAGRGRPGGGQGAQRNPATPGAENAPKVAGGHYGAIIGDRGDEGRFEQTSESSTGTSATHRVGRGVIRR